MFPCMAIHLTVEVCPVSTCLHTPVSASQTWQTRENSCVISSVSVKEEQTSVNVEHCGASLSKQRRAASFGKLAQGSPVLLASYSTVSQAVCGYPTNSISDQGQQFFNIQQRGGGRGRAIFEKVISHGKVQKQHVARCLHYCFTVSDQIFVWRWYFLGKIYAQKE